MQNSLGAPDSNGSFPDVPLAWCNTQNQCTQICSAQEVLTATAILVRRENNAYNSENNAYNSSGTLLQAAFHSYVAFPVDAVELAFLINTNKPFLGEWVKKCCMHITIFWVLTLS